MRRLCALLLGGLALVAAVVVGVALLAAPAPGDGRATVLVYAPAADSPSPSLGATPQPGVNPPGDTDADPSDFDQVPLAVISFLALGAIVGGALGFYLWRRSRRTRDLVRHRRDSDDSAR